MFWTSPGQTFLISLFGEVLRHEFNLSHGQFGTLYTASTLASAICLWSAGKWVDRFQLEGFVWWICVAMAAGAAGFSLVGGPISLFIGILVVRFLGQGMMTHIAITAMARRYINERGRSIAIAGFGFPVAVGILPPLITYGLTLTTWPTIWMLLGAAIAFTMLPTIPFLLKRTNDQNGKGTAALTLSNTKIRNWTRAEMLKDPRFFMVAPLIMTMSAISTGIIFHQTHIISDVKNWDFFWWSLCFTVFAASEVAGGFVTGWLIDRFSAQQITPYILVPFAVSLATLASVETETWAIIILGSMGLSAGATNPSFSSLWTELYGTKYLGSIRSVGAVLIVFASALGPMAIGSALDFQVQVTTIVWISVLITCFTSGLAWFGLRPQSVK